MAKEADTVAKRLAELFTGGLGARLSARLKTLEQELGPAANVVIPDGNAVLPAWVDPIITIFSLNPSSTFDQAVLNKNPVHWKLLVTLFSWAHFGKWRSRGRPLKWTGEKYSQLLHEFSKIRNEKPTVPDIEVCRLLKKRRPDRYTQQSAERLAKEVKKAQDPKFNPALAHLLNMLREVTKVDYQRLKLDWSAEVEASKRKEFLESVLKRAGAKKRLKADAPHA
jgi:hypothetical protein